MKNRGWGWGLTMILRIVLITALTFTLTACFSDEEGGEEEVVVVSETASITLTASPESINADGASSSAITATLTDNTGQPVAKGTSVAFSTTLGAFSNGSTTYQTTTPDDTGTVKVSLISSTTEGTAGITVTSNGVTQRTDVEFVATSVISETASITLTAAPSSINAVGASSSAITATLTDNTGQPVAKGTSVAFSTTLGIFSSGGTTYQTTTPDDTGTVTVSLISSTTTGTAEITVTSNGITQRTTVVFISTTSETASITLTAAPDTIKADGASSSAITATLTDNTGQPVSSGTSVTFSTTLGTFSNGSTTYQTTTPGDTGTVTVSLTSSTTAGTAQITVTSNGVTQRITVTFTSTTTITLVPAAIGVTSSLNSINPGESTEVYAKVFTASGEPIPDLEVIFTLDNPVLAYITSIATTSSEGIATAIFTARDLPGEVGITATAESVSNDTPKKITILDQSAPSQINLTANPTSILVQGTCTVTAQVLDADGNPVPNGTAVIFEVDNELYGSISADSITNAGLATATFTASDQPGTATIDVSSGSASSSIDIEILQAPAASIEFVSAEPQVIAIKESGGVENSLIKFIVKDSNGSPLEGINVSLKMDGPNGEEYIDSSDDGTPDEIVVSTNTEGIAQVILHSGYVAGPVTISATIDIGGTPMTVQSSVVSIGGGVPSIKRFSVAASVRNLPGLVYNNRTTDITAFLADRFGNYNILKGTTVSFASEVALAIDTSQVTLLEDGLATVTARTQSPAYSGIDAPEDVLPEAWEVDLQNYLAISYNYVTTANPRDGLCSILVYTKGEEHFDDSNANGMYDLGETFVDQFDDPFCDYNDSGTYDGPASQDPEELYIDSADPPDGQWDGQNGVWDSNKHIFCSTNILITGAPKVLFRNDTASGFAVPDGGGLNMAVIVCDDNLNPMTAGSSVSISTDVGKLAGSAFHEYADIVTPGPVEYFFYLYDADPGDEEGPEMATISITVEWEGITYTYQLLGTVD